jgi:hypothetical protein
MEERLSLYEIANPELRHVEVINRILEEYITLPQADKDKYKELAKYYPKKKISGKYRKPKIPHSMVLNIPPTQPQVNRQQEQRPQQPPQPTHLQQPLRAPTLSVSTNSFYIDNSINLLLDHENLMKIMSKK